MVKLCSIGEQLIKQDGLVGDPTGTIKVTFWGDHVDTQEKGKTYNFKNFLYKNDNFGIYLSTAKSMSVIEEADDFQTPVAKPDLHVQALQNKQIVVNLLGVTSAVQYFSCLSCNRKIDHGENAKSVFCVKCNVTVKASRCPKQWVVKLLVEEAEDPKHKFQVTAFNNIVQQLIALCFTDVPLSTMTPEQLTKYFVEDIDKLKITYDIVQKTIVELN